MKLSKRCVPGAAETPVRSNARPSLPGTQGGFKSSCLPQTPPCSQPLRAAPLRRCCRCGGSCYPREMAISAPNEGWKRSAAQVGSIPGGSSPASPAQLGAGSWAGFNHLSCLPGRMRLRFREGVQRQKRFKELFVCACRCCKTAALCLCRAKVKLIHFTFSLPVGAVLGRKNTRRSELFPANLY